LDVVIALLLVLAVVWYVRRHLRHDRASRAVLTARGAVQRGRAPGSVTVQRDRPRAVPASALATEDRPTFPEIESMPSWPNRFARPVEPDEPGRHWRRPE